MFEIFFAAFNAVFPLVLLILIGYLLKRIKFLSKEFLRVGNKFVFNVCLPCMLFVNIYDKMNSFSQIPWTVVLYAVIVILVIFALGLLTARFATNRKNRRGVILQCTFRSNFAIIGLALVERLGGDGVFGGIISAFSIPVFNILAVISLTLFAEGNGVKTPLDGSGEQLSIPLEESKEKKPLASVGKILLNIVKNPLIIGVCVGLLFVGIREIERAACGGDVPFRFDTHLKFLYVCVSDLKAIASPLALVILGGQFEFSAVRGMTKEIAVATVWRIVVAPLLGIGIAVLISTYAPQIMCVTPAEYPTFIALFGTPVAVSSAIMAGQMGGDEQLATQLVVWTSIGSILTIFVTVAIMMSCGLLLV